MSVSSMFSHSIAMGDMEPFDQDFYSSGYYVDDQGPAGASTCDPWDGPEYPQKYVVLKHWEVCNQDRNQHCECVI